MQVVTQPKSPSLSFPTVGAKAHPQPLACRAAPFKAPPSLTPQFKAPPLGLEGPHYKAPPVGTAETGVSTDVASAVEIGVQTGDVNVFDFDRKIVGCQTEPQLPEHRGRGGLADSVAVNGILMPEEQPEASCAEWGDETASSPSATEPPKKTKKPKKWSRPLLSMSTMPSLSLPWVCGKH